MNELTRQGDKRMTTAEVCAVLGCDRTTLIRNWREIETCAGAAQVKTVENGKPTYWTEAEVTLLLEKMKRNANNQHDLAGSLQGVDTSKSRVLRLQILQKQMQEIYEAEIAELREENAELKPKAETLDKITATKSDVSVRELAAILAVPHLGQNNLFEKLRSDGYIDGLNRPYRQYIEAGLIYEKEYYVPHLDATKRQLRITQKGVAYFARRYGKVTA